MFGGKLKDMLKKMPAIQSEQGVADPKAKAMLGGIKRILEHGLGLNNTDEAWVSKETLKGPTGIMMDILSNAGRITPNISLDFTTPPTPENLSTVSTFSSVILSWDAMGYRNHGYTEIFRSTTDNLSEAVSIGRQFVGTSYVDTVATNLEYFYWIRFVSLANVPGPYNGSAGTSGKITADPSDILSALGGGIDESHLAEALANDIELLRNERTLKVDANGRVAGIGVAVQEGASGDPEGAVIIYSDRFAIMLPGAGATERAVVPFIVGRVNGRNTVGVNGQLVVDESIHGRSIVAESITADKITAEELSAIAAALGTVTGGLFRTAEAPQTRVEVASSGGYLLWAGAGAKNDDNAIFFIDENGNAVFKGSLESVNGTFSGVLNGASGVFNGTVYAENLVGDVVDRLWEEEYHVSTVYNQSTPVAVGNRKIAPTISQSSWLTVETISIGAASFARKCLFEGMRIACGSKGPANWTIQQYGNFGVRLVANGVVLADLNPQPWSGYGNSGGYRRIMNGSGIGGLTLSAGGAGAPVFRNYGGSNPWRGQVVNGASVVECQIYNAGYSIASQDEPILIDIPANTQMDIEMQVYFSGWSSLSSTYMRGVYDAIGRRKVEVFKTESEGIARL